MKKTYLILSLFSLAVAISGCKNDQAVELKDTPVNENVSSDKAPASFKVESISKSQLPTGLKFEGQVKFLRKYSDNSGEHYVVLTESGILPSKNTGDIEYGNDAKIYAYDFLMTNGGTQQTWRIHDFITNCEFDLMMGFKENSFNVTDLDKDGTAEVWIMYAMICTSDVSPSELKLIMYEGDKKHAMRGYTLVDIGNNEKMGGEFKLDENFKSSGKEIQDYAMKLWKSNCETGF